MPNFKELYKQTKVYPAEAFYKGKKVVIADKFPVSDQDTLIFTVEHTNSKYKQGFSVDVEGTVKFLSKKYRKGKRINFFLWERPEPYELQIFTNSSEVYIQNAWYDPSLGENAPTCYADGQEWLMNDKWGGAGMIVEEIENGRRYYCNDGECDDDFDDIIFSVTRKPKLENNAS